MPLLAKNAQSDTKYITWRNGCVGLKWIKIWFRSSETEHWNEIIKLSHIEL